MNGPRSWIADTRDASWRVSLQRVDPLATLSARPLASVGCAAAFGYGVFATVRQWDEVQQPVIALAALTMLALACAVFLVAARPVGAPFGARAAAVIVVLGVIAAGLETASRLGHNLLLQDDYGQVSLAILLALMAPYRPAIALVRWAIAASAALAFLPLAQVPFLTVQAPYVEYVVVLVVPPLALGLAGAAFANGFVQAVRDWQRTVSRAALEIEDEAETGLARSVQQQQVTVLSHDVLPFLGRGITAQTVDLEDVATARSLAAALRGTLLAELGRSWLDDVAAETTLSAGGAPSVDDPRMLALTLGREQRVATAAVFAAICESTAIAASAVTVALTSALLNSRSTVSVIITATVRGGIRRREVERELVQYLAVVRVLFDGVLVRVTPDSVTVGFDHVQS